VAVARVEVGAERLQVDADLPGRVGAVDDGEDAGPPARSQMSSTGKRSPVAELM